MDESKQKVKRKNIDISMNFTFIIIYFIINCGRKKTNIIKSIDKKNINWYNIKIKRILKINTSSETTESELIERAFKFVI